MKSNAEYNAWKKYIEENAYNIADMFGLITQGEVNDITYTCNDKTQQVFICVNVTLGDKTVEETDEMLYILRMVKVAGVIYDVVENDGATDIIIEILPHALTLAYISETRWLIPDREARESIWMNEYDVESEDLIGKRFGNLTVLNLVEDDDGEESWIV